MLACRPVERASRRLWLRGFAATVAALAGTGCGFQLRRAAQLNFGSVALLGFAAPSPLAAELRRQLGLQVRVLESPDQAAVVLQSLGEQRERFAVATTASAEVRELLLRQRLQLWARTAGGRELVPPTTWVVERTMSYRESAALAKSHEEAETFQEMQIDIVGQVLRRLAMVVV